MFLDLFSHGESRICLTAPDVLDYNDGANATESSSSAAVILAARKCLDSKERMGDSDTEMLPCLSPIDETKMQLLHCLREVRSLSRLELPFPRMRQNNRRPDLSRALCLSSASEMAFENTSSSMSMPCSRKSARSSSSRSGTTLKSRWTLRAQDPARE